MNAKVGKCEEGLLQAMKAIDNQIARALQRTPAERELQGVQKWEPYESRIEHVTAFLLNQLGDSEIAFDSLIVFAQAFTKALRFAAEDLGTEGLGAMRTEYCRDAMQKIERDAGKALSEMYGDALT
jgi:hypothetical protein